MTTSNFHRVPTVPQCSHSEGVQQDSPAGREQTEVWSLCSSPQTHITTLCLVLVSTPRKTGEIWMDSHTQDHSFNHESLRNLESSQAVVVHSFNPGTLETEAGGSLKASLVYKGIPGQTGLHGETRSRKTKQNKQNLKPQCTVRRNYS